MLSPEDLPLVLADERVERGFPFIVGSPAGSLAV